MEAKKTSLRARSVSTGNLLRPYLFSLLILFAACAPVTEAPHADGFHVHWEILMLTRNYLYLGDNLPECTDAEADMMAYRRDRTLMICTGGEHGDDWQPVVIGGTESCNTYAR
jgi:hypothetical protein